MSSLRRCGVGVIVDSRKGFTQTLFGPTFPYAVASFFKGELQRNEQHLNTSLFSNSVLAN